MVTATRTNGAKGPETITALIAPAKMAIADFLIEGTSPYVQHAFSAKARAQIRATQEAGSTSRARKVREPKDFQQVYEDAMHRSTGGWPGIPAASFRNAMISACRAAGFVMTRAKLAVFVEADGYDANGTALVKITQGEPHYHESYARNETGVVDLRARPMWDAGWQAIVRVRFDASMLSATDVANLLARAGLQVGVGEGRPDSPNSNGLGWGLFTLVQDET